MMVRLLVMVSAIVLALGVSSGDAPAADVGGIYAHAADVNAGLFFKTSDSTVYVSTGDIDAMWLRDSSVQSMSVMRNRALIHGVMARQARLIALDPYANAFHRDYSVAEQKFELDSLCYPVLLANRYVNATGDTSIFDARMFDELQAVLHTIIVEQNHTDRSHYHRNEHPVQEGIGLIWSAYRPSDDNQVYNYNIPENMFAETTLRVMSDFLHRYYHDARSAHKAQLAAERINQAIQTKAIFSTKHGRIYAYEIDGLGHAKFMDDANVPSLLSVPLLGYGYDKSVYANTRRFILSPANRYYFKGHFAAGIGSPHTPEGFVWPMSLIVQYRTADGKAERGRIVQELLASGSADGALHESFDVNDPRRYTRPKFGWVNALFEQTFLTPE
ncbi:MAG: metal-independent alpha-mannosidase [Candidatus Eremiobacter antarcticus]|nr:glycoside hydrolase family 125 protein [Candidatus Eremiobacteraeota bacterium]MBC5807830.1 glycoside hydrolase family 125 protein [Candidatus Eremiobacteraeota bacterium]PZR62794.1 MAG: metal-independent alpha-mannosidase [Candidatus Eremiobacter sp. RRmetagenome_bin22]